MGFDDIFEHGHKHHKYSHDHHCNHVDYNYQTTHPYGHQNDLKYQLLSKLQNNPKLRLLLIAGAIIAAIVLIIIVILLFPLVAKLFHFIGENGLQGLIDAIWKGTK